MSDLRVSVLDALRRHPDPQHSTDPQVRTVVQALGRLEIAPEPDAQFRAELRAQLVAVAPRLIADGATEADTAPAGARSGRRVAKHAPDTRRSFARPLTIAASVVTLLALVLAGTTWLSQRSLPGGTLYGLKRASEDVRVALASNSTAAANDRLQFATTRVGEARQLLHQPEASALGRGPQADGGVNAHTAALVTGALKAADDDVLSASRQLTENAVAQKSDAPLAGLLAWAPGQLGRLRRLAAAAPSSGLRARATKSLGIVDAAQARAGAVRAVATYPCMSGARSDRFGPVPCASSTAPTTTTLPSTTGVPETTPQATSAPRQTTGASEPAKRQGTAVGSTSHAGSTGHVGVPSTLPVPRLSTPHLHKGHLPKPSLSVPIAFSSCSVSISVGPIGVNVGSCPSK